jgi:hypothetical protein
MIHKSKLYKKEQEDICDKVIDILELDDKNSITLYNLDNSKDKQDKIMALIPEIRKYFSFSSIIGASEPKMSKRPWLSIIRHITKLKYDMIHGDYRITVNSSRTRTKLYVFIIQI